jgi:hypothetical protein
LPGYRKVQSMLEVRVEVEPNQIMTRTSKRHEALLEEAEESWMMRMTKKSDADDQKSETDDCQKEERHSIANPGFYNMRQAP